METFLRKYLDSTALAQMPPSVVKNLIDLEEVLNKQTESSDFQTVMKEYGPNIVDLIKRIADHVNKWKWSSGRIVNSLKFVIDIAKEVHQIVEAVQAKIVPLGTAPELAEQKKILFGVDMVYFIWSIVDPLRGRLNWLPFERSLEKWAVRKLAMIGIQHAMSFFKANPQFVLLGEGNITIVKSL